MHSYKSPRPPRTPRSPRSNASSRATAVAALTSSLPVDTGKASLFLYVEALQKQLVAAQHAAHVATQEADSLRKAYAPRSRRSASCSLRPPPPRLLPRRGGARAGAALAAAARERRGDGARRARARRARRAPRLLPPRGARRPAASCRRRCARNSAPAWAAPVPRARQRAATRRRRRAAQRAGARAARRARPSSTRSATAARAGMPWILARAAGGGRARSGGGQRDLPRGCRRLRGRFDGAVPRHLLAAGARRRPRSARSVGGRPPPRRARRRRAHRWRRRRIAAEAAGGLMARCSTPPRASCDRRQRAEATGELVVLNAAAAAATAGDGDGDISPPRQHVASVIAVPLKDSLGRVRAIVHACRPRSEVPISTDEAKNIASVAALGTLALENASWHAALHAPTAAATKAAARRARRPS